MPNIQKNAPVTFSQQNLKVEQNITSVKVETTQNIQIQADQVNIIQVQPGGIPANAVTVDLMKARIAELERQLASQQGQKPEGGIKPDTSPRPYPINPPSTSDKQQAWEQLRRAENDDEQARQNLQLVLESRQPYESLGEVTNCFLSVMRSEGGSSSTTQAQAAFRAINDVMRTGVSRVEALSAYTQIHNAENDSAQALQSLQQISRSRRPGESLERMAGEFNQVLRTVGGSSSTEAAQRSFAIIHTSLKPGESRSEAINAFVSLHQAENDSTQAQENYDIVNHSLRPGESRQNGVEVFNQLLRAHGGSSSTDEARASFRLVNDRMKNYESRNEVAETLIRHIRAENDNQQARDNFSLVDSLLRPGESRSQETDAFISILRQEGGSSATDKARASYRAIKQW